MIRLESIIAKLGTPDAQLMRLRATCTFNGYKPTTIAASYGTPGARVEFEVWTKGKRQRIIACQYIGGKLSSVKAFNESRQGGWKT